MRRIARWWLTNWDYLLVVACVMVFALLAGGALSKTVEAIQAGLAGY